MYGQVAVSAQLRPRCSCTSDKEVSQVLFVRWIFNSNASLYNNLASVSIGKIVARILAINYIGIGALDLHYKVLFIHFCIH